MASLVLTDSEVIEVRLQVGAAITIEQLSDIQITSTTTLGAASDYVFERVREGLDLSRLTQTERAIAERFRDETPDDIASFVNEVLKPPQVSQFRRAVIFRTAGLCAPLVDRVHSETAGDILERVEVRPFLGMQNVLFQRADEEIARLREAFQDDAFTRPRWSFFKVT